MLEEASELIGLQVYTNKAIYLGTVNNLVVDLDESQIQGLFISETNPLLVENSKAVNVPFRWVGSVGDIVLLKYFPRRVGLKRSAPSKKDKELKDEIESV
jgi:sporulation protein YlmC with PRC-barrel domain